MKTLIRATENKQRGRMARGPPVWHAWSTGMLDAFADTRNKDQYRYISNHEDIPMIYDTMSNR